MEFAAFPPPGAAPLLFTQPDPHKRLYELRSGDALLAQLDCTRPAFATAVSRSHHWVFTRTGFLRPQVAVRALGLPSPSATFISGWFSGQVSLPLRSYSFIPTPWWGRQWEWRQGRQGLIRYAPRKGKMECALTLLPSDLPFGDLPLLALLGCHLLVLYAEDAAVASLALSFLPSPSSPYWL